MKRFIRFSLFLSIMIEVLESINFGILPEPIMVVLLSLLLGLFIGLEREWSDKPAGIRTFSLIAIIGGLGSYLYSHNQAISIISLVSGFTLVILFSVFLAYWDSFKGLSLTTSTSLMITLLCGVLIGQDLVMVGVTVAILSVGLLALKKELHDFADDRSKEEIKSTIEFSVIAFIVLPLLPNEELDFLFNINPTLIWYLVIAVTSVGMINYILAAKFGDSGFLISGFLGGFVNSTAVVYDAVGKLGDLSKKPITIVMITNSSMIMRNAIIALIFIPSSFLILGVPLAAMSVTGVLFSYFYYKDSDSINMELDSPFNLYNAMKFGGFFLGLTAVSNIGNLYFGESAVILSTFLGGLVSSGSSTTTAILLLSSGTISNSIALISIIGGTVASILVKIILVSQLNRRLLKPLVILSSIKIIIGFSIFFFLTI